MQQTLPAASFNEADFSGFSQTSNNYVRSPWVIWKSSFVKYKLFHCQNIYPEHNSNFYLCNSNEAHPLQYFTPTKGHYFSVKYQVTEIKLSVPCRDCLRFLHVGLSLNPHLGIRLTSEENIRTVFFSPRIYNHVIWGLPRRGEDGGRKREKVEEHGRRGRKIHLNKFGPVRPRAQPR